MKMKYLAAMTMVLFMLGCSTQQQATDNAISQQDAPVAQNEQQDAPSSSNIDIVVSASGFDPETAAISAGDTVVWKITDDGHKLIHEEGGLFDSGELSKGDTYEYAFADAGSYTIYDAVTKKSMGITVE